MYYMKELFVRVTVFGRDAGGRAYEYKYSG